MATVNPELVSADEAFFLDHQDRKIHIRRPKHDGEFRREFQTLGGHQYERRRLLIVRLEPTIAKKYDRMLMEIPFLAFADETIEDRDDILLPILREIMGNEGKKYRFG